MSVTEEEYQPSLRFCQVLRPNHGSYGFHLSRTQWDPYPWVSEVEVKSPAECAGLQVGDCVLEVNGEDVLGQRIGEVAIKVYTKQDHVKLLVWNAGSESNGAVWLTGNGPTPLSLQRLASCLQSVVQLLECPVCLETAPPPAFQCCNGHVLCGDCRAQADKCPVCRVTLGTRGRCLLADKLHSLLTSTFLQTNKKPKRSKIRSKPLTNLQIRSRYKKAPEVIELNSEKPMTRYNCPVKDCTTPVSGQNILLHLKSHDGPLVQYYCTQSSTRIRLPISSPTVISLPRGEIFFLNVVAHTTVGCLLVWLWLPEEDANRYTFNLEFPNRKPLTGSVFPLSMSADHIINSAADRCIVLDEWNSDVNCDNFSLDIVDTTS